MNNPDDLPNISVVDFAYQIIEMHQKLCRQKWELEELREYKEKYENLLSESLAHSQAMMGNILKFSMTPGVIEACQANKTFQETDQPIG